VGTSGFLDPPAESWGIRDKIASKVVVAFLIHRLALIIIYSHAQWYHLHNAGVCQIVSS